jgi:uncharacterized protein (TIGR02594 family)
VPTIASLVSNKILKLGMAGLDVKELQLALGKLGYPLNGTGYFGAKTDTAVEMFQRKAGLDPDGDVGTATAQAIDAALAGARPGTGRLAPPPPLARPLWLDYSIAHIGTKEAPGSKDNRELVADIRTVAPEYQHDETPWCAGWVSLCLVKAEQKPSKQPLWARSYADGWGVKLIGPALGAIAVKTRQGGGHVTFVAGRNRNGMLACCGGNQNNMVNITEYAPTAFNLGFFWPKDTPLPALIGISTLPIVGTSGRAASEA